MAKPKVAFYWGASCGGCEESIIDLNEDLLKVIDAVDIVFWPIALDFKYKNIENLKDGEIAVSFINGAVRLGEQEEFAHLLRKKSKIVIAFGSCAHLGGIPGLANFHDKERIFKTVYKEAPSVINPEGKVPLESTKTDEGELKLPKFYDTVKTLNQIIDVDYYIPGCPPPADLVMQAVTAVLQNNLPSKGSVIGPTKPLCADCSRRDSKPDKMAITEIKRLHEVIIDPEKCFLVQGLICLGPATRSGCGEKCIKGNMPCKGCFGPTDTVIDQGGKILSALSSIIDTNNEEEIKKVIDSVADMAGTFYRFTLPSSLLKRKRKGGKNV